MFEHDAAYDVIIVGGGPSGLSTALHLAQKFPYLIGRTLVLEKAWYPRPKLCAGGLLADVEVILQRLGLDVSEVPHVDASKVRLDFEGKGLGLSVPSRHALRVVRRDEFDAWLAQKAQERGIAIRQGVTVKDVRPEAEAVEVETDEGILRGRVVVGADGSNGITRRRVLPHAPLSTARALEILTPEIEGKNSGGSLARQPARGKGHDGHEASVAYFDFFPVPSGIAGYTWDFPTQVKGTRMRCWGVYDTNLLATMRRPGLKETLAREMRRHGYALEDYELQGHPIRWFDPTHPVSAPRVLLVGDAAGADPEFGEGISIALGYGALAAQEIGEAFQTKDFSFHGYKRRIMGSALGQSLFIRWLIANVTYTLRWRWFQMLLWRVMKPIVLVVGWLFVVNWGKRLR